MTVKILLAFELWWLTLIMLQCHIHFYMIDILKHKPKYLLWFGIRGVTALFFLFLIYTQGVGWHVVPEIVFLICSHFVLFNPTVNRLRANHNPLLHITFWYLGRDSGWFDKLFLRYKILHRIVYYAAFILMVWSAFSLIELYSNY